MLTRIFLNQIKAHGLQALGLVLMGLVCVSCAEQFNMTGDTSVTTLDGRMLYLKATNGVEMRNVDSCEVIHGKFNFMGMVDTVSMGEIYMDNEGFMPIVIENGNMSIVINNTEQRVMGGMLNNRLYDFLEKHALLEEEIMNQSNDEARMILSGVHPFTAHHKVSQRTNQLYNAIEQLEADFIANNSRNILGITYFMMLCNQYPYPIITPQIERILKKSGQQFKDEPFVKNYTETARSNMKLIQSANGTKIKMAH